MAQFANLSSLLILFLLFLAIPTDQDNKKEINQAKQLLKNLNQQLMTYQTQENLALWKYRTDANDYSLKRYLSTTNETFKLKKNLLEQIKRHNWKNVNDEDIMRQLKLFLLFLAPVMLTHAKNLELEETVQKMMLLPYTTKIPKSHHQNSPEIPVQEIDEIFRTSRNVSELLFLWLNWSQILGPTSKNYFDKNVQLMNEIAKTSNVRDASDLWLELYEIPDIKNKVNKWYKEILPLYKELHAYVRWKLRSRYQGHVTDTGGIPAHLIGNLFGENWSGLQDLIIPYPSESAFYHIEKELKTQRYTALSMCKKASEFMTSLNFPTMPPNFWSNSLFYKPSNHIVMDCILSGKDKEVWFAKVLKPTEKYFFLAHRIIFAAHLMSSRNYHLPFIYYQMDPIPGFWFTLSDCLAQYVKIPGHLKKISLLPNATESYEAKINHLFFTALSSVVSLPYNYVIDLWKWQVFSGRTPPENYNCEWWKLRFEYEGIEPPENRSESDFDLAMNVDNLRNGLLGRFVGNILLYQCYRQFCVEAGLYPRKTLQECDIYENKAAGELIQEGIFLGKSKPFPEVLEILTGSRIISTKGILEYFNPLMSWLVEENRKNNVFIGWKNPEMVCVGKS